LTALAIAALLLAAPATARPPVDQELRQRLAVALADEGSFSDRFEAEVWLADRSTRLAGRIPEPERRLNLLRHIHYEARRADLPPALVLAVIEVESNFDRFAISEAGAQGLMQVMPFWLKELDRPDDNLFDVRTNLRMGCTILRYYLEMENADTTRALARYNGSLGKFWYPDRVYQALRSRWYP